MNRIDLSRVLIAIALLAAGMLIGGAGNSGSQAHGQSRGGPQPPVFQSGGQLSVPLLKDISVTLQQIDARLARLEIVAQKIQTTDVKIQMNQ